MAKIRITRAKDGISWMVEDNETTRKAIKGHNHYAKEDDQWLVDDPSAPPRLTKDQEIAKLRAENAAFKAQAEQKETVTETSGEPVSTDYDPARAIQLIQMITDPEELVAFTKGERRDAVKKARDTHSKTINK